ncbi:MAG: type transport system permease protein [Clostridia bacterium]|nr:type transport system permease protein [Clostridia bacterium]
MEFYTVFWREMIVLKRTFYKFFASRLVSPLLYLVAFGWGLGRGIRMDGGNYLPLGVAYLIKALPLTHTSYALRSLAQGQGLLPVSLAVLGVYAALLFIAAVESWRRCGKFFSKEDLQ